jgi:hypothetical protein
LQLVDFLISRVVNQGPKLLGQFRFVREHLLTPVSTVDDQVSRLLLEPGQALRETTLRYSIEIFIYLVLGDGRFLDDFLVELVIG